MRTCAFVTLGCKINQYETEAIREEVLSFGLQEVLPQEPADLYVVNACSVTHESGAKSRRAVLRLARTNPRSRILVMGCASPAERLLLRKIPQVAAVLGNDEKGAVPELVREGLPQAPGLREGARSATTGEEAPGRLRVARTRGPGVRRDVLDLQVTRFKSRTRAYVKVQDGCNGFCSFCIIPFLRGTSRSRPRQAVLDEVKRLAANGYREIVVTGIHLQDYGPDLQESADLVDLLAAVAACAGAGGIRRVRLSSLGPRAFTADLVDLLRSDDVFCPHWHIPLQSGDDSVLALMRRDYGGDDFLAAVERLRAAFPRPSITTDVIVGHPGETEEAFGQTLEICQAVGFSKIHIFPFSAREGTRAAALPGRVPASEAARRARAMQGLERELALRFKKLFAGETVEILAEGESAEGAGTAAAHLHPEPPRGSWIEGYTERYLRVRAPAIDPASLRNGLLRVRVERVQADLLEGALVRGPKEGEERESP